MHSYRLQVAALQKSPAFNLSEEDPLLYSQEDLEGYNPAREWPDEDLPTAAIPQSGPAIPPEVIQKAMSMHHIQCDMLKALGMDPCREYANKGPQAELERVVAGDKVCSICDKELGTTQRLRHHIMTQHMSSTSHQCSQCHRSFGDNYTLDLHMKTHGEKPFKCSHEGCTKSFPTVGRLNEHKKVHNPATSNFACKHKCGETFPQRKNCISHELYCSKGPARPKIQCPYCPKKILRLSDFKRHGKKVHSGREIMKDVVLPQYLQDLLSQTEKEPGNGDNGDGDDE